MLHPVADKPHLSRIQLPASSARFWVDWSWEMKFSFIWISFGFRWSGGGGRRPRRGCAASSTRARSWPTAASTCERSGSDRDIPAACPCCCYGQTPLVGSRSFPAVAPSAILGGAQQQATANLLVPDVVLLHMLTDNLPRRWRPLRELFARVLRAVIGSLLAIAAWAGRQLDYARPFRPEAHYQQACTARQTPPVARPLDSDSGSNSHAGSSAHYTPASAAAMICGLRRVWWTAMHSRPCLPVVCSRLHTCVSCRCMTDVDLAPDTPA